MQDTDKHSFFMKRFLGFCFHLMFVGIDKLNNLSGWIMVYYGM